MRLALVSPAVTLACLGEEVLGLGTRKHSQAFHCCCPTTHTLTLQEGSQEGIHSLQRPWAGQFPVHSPPQAFVQKVEFSATGKAGQGRHIQGGSPGLWVSPPQILANV